MTTYKICTQCIPQHCINFNTQRKDCFTITLGQKTGTTFPIDINNQKVYTLYDTGAGCNLINYSMYETLGTDLDKGYMPQVRSSTGEDMGALGQVTYTFKINGTPFTQSFIDCRNMNTHIILGTDFTAMNFAGVIWNLQRNTKANAFQWEDHHGTTRHHC